jgi:hypothetical protein
LVIQQGQELMSHGAADVAGQMNRLPLGPLELC